MTYQEHYDSEASGFYRSTGLGVDPADVAEDVLPNPNELPPTGPKVSCLVSPEPTDDELKLLVQMGVTHCFTWISSEQSTLPFVTGLVERVAAAGLVLYNIGNRALGKSADIILGTADRDARIDEFGQFLRVLAEAGVRLTTFTWEAEGIVWNTHRGTTRGNTEARAVSASVLARIPPSQERTYPEEELWDNMKYFFDKILPVAESLGVRLALHPNDPPLPAIGGIPNLMRSKAAYDRAIELAGKSPALAMEFCCGCWLEGGESFGDLYACLADFCRAKRVAIVHLRNVTCPLPTFTETFMDAGYGDIYRILRILVHTEYEGTIILDHTPPFVAAAGPGAPTAFSVGYMKAGLRAATAERDHLFD